jgi:uncharacterized protein involved in exopolysaccharide biosynthesis
VFVIPESSLEFTQPALPVVTPLRLANAILRQRRWMVACALGLSMTVLAYSLVRPPRFTSTAAIIPQLKTTGSNLSGIASQFGLSLPTESGSQQPAFYVEILTSTEMFRRVATSHYTILEKGAARSLSLVELYEPKERDPELALEKTIQKLRKTVNATLSPKAGIVYVEVSAHSPEVAQALNQRLLQQVDSFNRASRRGQGGAERQFVEARLAETSAELRTAENRLQSFLEANRQYRESPLLAFQQDRLAREVATRQQLYTTLVQAFEPARLQEVRDTPIFSELQAPTLPPHAESRNLLRNGVLALLLGAFLGLVLGTTVSASTRSPEYNSDLEELRQLWAGRKRVGQERTTSI